MIDLTQNLLGDRDVRPQRGVVSTPRCTVEDHRLGRTVLHRAGALASILLLLAVAWAGPAGAGIKARNLRVAAMSGDTLTLACELWSPKQAPASPDSVPTVRYRFLVSVDGGAPLRDAGWRTVGVVRSRHGVTLTTSITGFVPPPDVRLNIAMLLDEGRGVRTTSVRRRQSVTNAVRLSAALRSPIPATDSNVVGDNSMEYDDGVPAITWGLLRVLYADGEFAGGQPAAGPSAVERWQERWLAPADPGRHDRGFARLPSGRSRPDAR